MVWKRSDRRCDAGGSGSGLGSVHGMYSLSIGLCGRESSSTKWSASMIKLLVAAMQRAPTPAATPNTHRCCPDIQYSFALFLLLDQSLLKKVSVVRLFNMCYNVT